MQQPAVGATAMLLCELVRGIVCYSVENSSMEEFVGKRIFHFRCRLSRFTSLVVGGSGKIFKMGL